MNDDFIVKPKTFSKEIIANLELLEAILKRGEADIGSLFINNTKNFTANSVVSKGDPVYLRGDGKIENALSQNTMPYIKPNKNDTFLDVDIFGYSKLAYNSTNDVFLLAYTSDKLAAINPSIRLIGIKINSDNSITFGTEIQLDPDVWPIQEPLDLCYCSTPNQFFLVSRGVCAMVSVSTSLGISLGTTNYYLDTHGQTTSSTRKGMVVISTGSQVALSYVNSSSTTTRTLIANVSSNTIDFNASMVTTSDDGVNFTNVNIPTIANWQGITYGNSLFVAVAFTTEDTDSPSVMTSADGGATWSFVKVDSTKKTFLRVTYGNSLFVAVGSVGSVMTSANATSWTQQTAAENNTWNDVEWNGTVYAAVASSGTNRVMTSPDGVTWTARSAAEANSWNGVVWTGTQFVAVASNGTNQVMTSPDGITWSPQSASSNRFWRDIAWNGSILVAVTTDNVMTSADGITWADRTAQTGAWYRVTWDGTLGLFIVVGSSTDVMTSPDGLTWTNQAKTSSSSQFVATDGSGNIVIVGSESFTFSDIVTGGPTAVQNLLYSNKIIHIYSNSSNYCFRVGVITGNTIAFGTETVLNSVSVSQEPKFAFSDDRLMIFGVEITYDRIFAITGTISGTTITLSTPTYFDNQTFGSGGLSLDLSFINNRFIGTIANLVTPIGNIEYITFTNVGDTISFRTRYLTTNNRFLSNSANDGSNLLSLYTSQRDYGVRAISLPINSTPYIPYSFIGIAQEDAVEGDEIRVLLFGYDSNQTGLTPGKVYYIGNGELTTEKTDIPVGIAITSERILLKSI